jgi:hypothetical protein
MMGLQTNKAWAEHLDDLGVDLWHPIYVDLVNIFIAKSQFYSGWKEPFLRAGAQPDMKAWLEDQPDCKSDLELWGSKNRKKTEEYNFTDLVDWLKKRDVVNGKKPAGAPKPVKKEKKDKEDKKDKRKKKKKEESLASESEVEKKKKKKSKSKKYE